MNNAIKLLLVLSLSAILLTGCNTARGVGEDIQGLGMRFRVRSAKRLLAHSFALITASLYRFAYTFR